MRALALAGVALLACSPLLAQVQSTAPDRSPAPDAVLRRLEVTRASIQDLAIPTGTAPFGFAVWLGDDLVQVDLAPHELRAADFQLLLDDGQALHRLPTPPSVTWRGALAGEARSLAAATVIDGRLRAIAQFDTGAPLFDIVPLADVVAGAPANRYVVFSNADSTRDAVSCGVDDEGPHVHRAPDAGVQAGVTQIAEIAIDADLEYYQRNGSNTTNVNNAVTQVLNAVGAIYDRDCGIDYTITTILVRTTQTYTTTDMQQLLPQFRSRWNAQHANIRRDVAHLFTGKGGFSGIVGIAYLSVICNVANAYGVDKAFSGFGTNVGLVAHELGHNWSAPHCDGANPCNIMCSGLGGCNSNLSAFGASSINTITNFRNSRTCLDQSGQPGEFTTFGQGCPGTGQSPPNCLTADPNGGQLTGLTRTNEYAYEVPNGSSRQVQGFSIFSQSTTGGTVTVSAAIYGDAGGGPTVTPLAQTTVQIGSSPGFYRADFSAPVTVNGTFFISIDHSAQNTVLSNISGTNAGLRAFWRRPAFSGNWTASGIIDRPSYRVHCVGDGQNSAVPQIAAAGVAKTNESFSVQLSEAAASASAFLLLGVSDQAWAGGALPQSLASIGAPGCNLLVSTDDAFARTTNIFGRIAVSLSIPNDPSLVGQQLFHQWVVLDAGANGLGVALSNGGRSTIGG